MAKRTKSHGSSATKLACKVEDGKEKKRKKKKQELATFFLSPGNVGGPLLKWVAEREKREAQKRKSGEGRLFISWPAFVLDPRGEKFGSRWATRRRGGRRRRPLERRGKIARETVPVPFDAEEVVVLGGEVGAAP